jgi:putative ABC transport system permease protein
VAIPLKYNLRNLLVRRLTSGLTALGIGLVIFALAWVLTLVHGLDRTMTSAVDPAIAILVRPSAISETSSNIDAAALPRVRVQPEVATAGARPLVSAEVVVNAFVPKVAGGRGGVIIRGVSPEGFELRRNVRLVSGRRFAAGSGEILLGRALIGVFAGLEPGKTVKLARSPWTVVGVFEAGGGAAESEVWGDVRAVMDDFRRETYSSFLVRLSDPAGFPAFAKRVEGDSQINLKAWTEAEYHAGQAQAASATRALGLMITALMALGAIFGAMNTMYSAVAGRVRDVGTLRALGFSRASILTSFLIEAVMIALAGGALGAVLALAVFHGQNASVTSLASFTEVQFKLEVTPRVVAEAFAVAGVMGILGGLLPAWRASRMPIVAALREL